MVSWTKMIFVYSQFIVHVLFQAFVFIFIIVSDKSKESQVNMTWFWQHIFVYLFF